MLNNHQICTIDLEDKKYKIKGRFLSDPTRGDYLGQFGEDAIDLYNSENHLTAKVSKQFL